MGQGMRMDLLLTTMFCRESGPPTIIHTVGAWKHGGWEFRAGSRAGERIADSFWWAARTVLGSCLAIKHFSKKEVWSCNPTWLADQRKR